MDDLDRSIVQQPSNGRAHLVILGAGATLQAFPNGDKHGRKLPLMNNIVEVCGLQPILDKHGLVYAGNNFEAFYSGLMTEGKHPQAMLEIEQAIFEYFSALELPDEPTLYDHLVLSLRSKDYIATFNWDPFLFQALERNWGVADLPTPIFLHGNVAVGFCDKHTPVLCGRRGETCGLCGKPRIDSHLLYPVANKNYSQDYDIERSWQNIELRLSMAYILTIFGYSAPETDKEAVSLMKRGWGDPEMRTMEEIEIIDKKDEDQLSATWEPFIHSHHVQYQKDFYNSIIANHPRRSFEAMFAQIVDAEFIENNPIPRHASWDELRQWLNPLIQDEEKHIPADAKP